MIKNGELDVEPRFVVCEEVVGRAYQEVMGDCEVCKCGLGCGEVLKL